MISHYDEREYRGAIYSLPRLRALVVDLLCISGRTMSNPGTEKGSVNWIIMAGVLMSGNFKHGGVVSPKFESRQRKSAESAALL
jgi:hypothetical protein